MGLASDREQQVGDGPGAQVGLAARAAAGACLQVGDVRPGLGVARDVDRDRHRRARPGAQGHAVLC